MNLLTDVLTYIRRLIKTMSDSSVTDALLIDYVNRFVIMDMDARIQLFDYKTTYEFLTSPGVDQYNMPLYNLQTEPGGVITPYPVYQGFEGPVFINGIQCPFSTERDTFNNIYPNYVQTLVQAGTGNGSSTYTLNLPFTSQFSNTVSFPYSSGIIRGHVDISGIIAEINATGNNQDPILDPGTGLLIPVIPVTSVKSAVFFTSSDATGANVVVSDSGQFLTTNVNCGLLMSPGQAPYGNTALSGGYTTTQNTINYVTGVAQNVTFPAVIPSGMPINASCIFYQLGLPRSVLFYNNTLTLRSPPNTQYVVSLTAFLSPAAFLSSSQALPFSYMAEYIARGSARKYLSDVGDIEQFAFYEELFKEQEMLVWKRSQRQWTSTRTQTIYSQGVGQGNQSNNFGMGTM